MNIKKEHVAQLVKNRVNALVVQTLEICFCVEDSNGTMRLSHQQRMGILQFVNGLDAKTGLYRMLNFLMQQHLETSGILSSVGEQAYKILHARFFDVASQWHRLPYRDEELVAQTLRRLAREHAQSDFEEAVKLTEKSAQNSETSGNSSI